MAKDGNLYISVPIHKENTVFFNAHRAFNYEDFLEKFKDLKLIESKIIYDDKLYSFDEFKKLDDSKFIETIVGLFHFRK